jgi:methylated-DNA-[protein]-cysteine S-methyltransferase
MDAVQQGMAELSIPTPFGPAPIDQVTLSETAGAITALSWGACARQEETALLRRARAWLERYSAGDEAEFDLPLAPAGTAFERRVWSALRAIPYGRTRTYGEISRVAGGSPRSVGRAVGKNPIPIIIPCHRVLAAGGIGGFSAPGGLATKRALLAIEAASRNTISDDLFGGTAGAAGGRPAITTSEARP